MIEQPLSDQRIIDCLNADYNIKVARLTFLPIGADMNASVYKADAQDQSSYFVKLKHGHHHGTSSTIIALLHDSGIQHIIPPIKTIHGTPIQHIDDFTLIVSPFIEGQDGFSRDLSNDQWVTLGKVMKKIHEIDVPPSIQRIIRREGYSPKWRDAVRALYVYIESEPGTDEISLKFMTFMKNQAAVIHRLVDRSEQLAKQIQHHTDFVLCHSDIHGGNVLMDGNDFIYMVDWDDPIMAPKERDLMFIGGGVANVWNRPHEEKFFYTGYGKTEINMALLAYYRHERIVEDIALYGQQLLLSSAGDQDSRIESYKHFIAQFEPQGVVEIAFKTDEYLK